MEGKSYGKFEICSSAEGYHVDKEGFEKAMTQAGKDQESTPVHCDVCGKREDQLVQGVTPQEITPEGKVTTELGTFEFAPADPNKGTGLSEESKTRQLKEMEALLNPKEPEYETGD